MRFAYADPPYIGCAHLYPEKEEVDHFGLCERLVRDYDGFALSCHTPSLRVLLPLLPESARVLAWIKPFAAYKKNVRPQFTWEPVIINGGRPLTRGAFETHRDWFYGMPPVFSGRRSKDEITTIKGTKSKEFCEWVLNCLGFDPFEEDSLDDLFPGSGMMGDIIAGFIPHDGRQGQCLRLVPPEQGRKQLEAGK